MEDKIDFYTVDDSIEEEACPYCNSPKTSDHQEFFDSGEKRYSNRKFSCGYHITRYSGYINKNEGPDICSNSSEYKKLHTTRFFQSLYRALNDSRYGDNDLRILVKDMLKKIENSYE